MIGCTEEAFTSECRKYKLPICQSFDSVVYMSAMLPGGNAHFRSFPPIQCTIDGVQ
jgi:hypothetical protein